MKVLSLQPPWAALVAHGCKKIETRSWSTRYRGPLLIHSSATPLRASTRNVRETPAIARALQAAGYAVDLHDLPRGLIIARCELVDVVPTAQIVADLHSYLGDDELAFGNFADGRYAWVLANVKPLATPIPAHGMLGLWNYDASVDAPLVTDL